MGQESNGHGEHDREGKTHSSAHFGESADGVGFESEAVVDSGVDTFDCGSSTVDTLPGWSIPRDRCEDTAIEVDRHADNATKRGVSPHG